VQKRARSTAPPAGAPNKKGGFVLEGKRRGRDPPMKISGGKTSGLGDPAAVPASVKKESRAPAKKGGGKKSSPPSLTQKKKKKKQDARATRKKDPVPGRHERGENGPRERRKNSRPDRSQPRRGREVAGRKKKKKGGQGGKVLKNPIDSFRILEGRALSAKKEGISVYGICK